MKLKHRLAHWFGRNKTDTREFWIGTSFYEGALCTECGEFEGLVIEPASRLSKREEGRRVRFNLWYGRWPVSKKAVKAVSSAH